MSFSTNMYFKPIITDDNLEAIKLLRSQEIDELVE